MGGYCTVYQVKVTVVVIVLGGVLAQLQGTCIDN